MNKIQLSNDDFPSLYGSADAASLKSQNRYFNALICYYLVLIAGALLGFFTIGYETFIVKIFAAIFFGIALWITIWLRTEKPESLWYNGRAVAESVKTRSWRWMMAAEPFADTENNEKDESQFINDLGEILKQNKIIAAKIPLSHSRYAISDQMKMIRKLPLNDKINVYREHRITNQENWYIKKASDNNKASKRWYRYVVLVNIIAIGLLLLNISMPNVNFPIGVFAVLSSSILGWTQSKKYNELAASYTLTAHEIVLIKLDSEKIQSPEQFSDFVINCENAFSREHTQWVAKRI